MKNAIVMGAGGFISNHLVQRLKTEGYQIKGIDRKYPEVGTTDADEFVTGDLRNKSFVEEVVDKNTDELYELAGEMGGAGYLFIGEHDADVLQNSALINLHVADVATKKRVGKVFYAFSACIYPKYNQSDPNAPLCSEHSAYPADPDSEYGWEKLFSERMYLAYHRNNGLNLRIGRLHNVYGPKCTWVGGHEKALAALCRKVAETLEGNAVEIWGDGLQTRSFLYIEDCLDGIKALMRSDVTEPMNIGSEETISIADFARLIIQISGKQMSLKYIDGPQGVRGRNSDNTMICQHTGWSPLYSLELGIGQTYTWVKAQISEPIQAS